MRRTIPTILATAAALWTLAGCSDPGNDDLLAALRDLTKPRPQAGTLEAQRAQILRALEQVPATTIMVERADPLLIEAMVLLEAEGTRLHFQSAAGRRLSLSGTQIVGLHGLGVDLVDVEFAPPPVLLPAQPATRRSFVTLDAQGRLRRDDATCQTGAITASPLPGAQRLGETCQFGTQTRQNWYDLTVENPRLVAARQWVSAEVAITFTVAQR